MSALGHPGKILAGALVLLVSEPPQRPDPDRGRYHPRRGGAAPREGGGADRAASRDRAHALGLVGPDLAHADRSEGAEGLRAAAHAEHPEGSSGHRRHPWLGTGSVPAGLRVDGRLADRLHDPRLRLGRAHRRLRHDDQGAANERLRGGRHLRLPGRRQRAPDHAGPPSRDGSRDLDLRSRQHHLRARRRQYARKVLDRRASDRHPDAPPCVPANAPRGPRSHSRSRLRQRAHSAHDGRHAGGDARPADDPPAG